MSVSNKARSAHVRNDVGGSALRVMELAEEKEAEARQIRSGYVEQLQRQTARVLPSRVE